MFKVTETGDGVRFEVKVQPRSSRNQITGIVNGVVKLKLTAPPVEGEANQALIRYFSDLLGVAKNHVSLVKGQSSRNKLIEITGITKEQLLRTIKAQVLI